MPDDGDLPFVQVVEIGQRYERLGAFSSEKIGVIADHGANIGLIQVGCDPTGIRLRSGGGIFGRRFGLRRVIIGGFLVLGTSTLAAGVLDDLHVSAALLLCGSLGAAMLDAVGGIPFMRSVRAFERPQMTTVHRTYVDLSELVPSALFAALLLVFPFTAVFIATGLAMFGFAMVAGYLPRRM